MLQHVGAQLSAHETLASVEGRLTDPALGTAMATVLADAESLDTSPPTSGSPADQVEAVERTREAALDHLASIQDAAAALFTDSYRYDLQLELTEWDASLAALDGAVAAGQEALAAGTGTPDARAALQSALDAAASVRGAEVDNEDIDLVIASGRDVDAARAQVEAATAALSG